MTFVVSSVVYGFISVNMLEQAYVVYLVEGCCCCWGVENRAGNLCPAEPWFLMSTPDELGWSLPWSKNLVFSVKSEKPNCSSDALCCSCCCWFLVCCCWALPLTFALDGSLISYD